MKDKAPFRMPVSSTKDRTQISIPSLDVAFIKLISPNYCRNAHVKPSDDNNLFLNYVCDSQKEYLFNQDISELAAKFAKDNLLHDEIAKILLNHTDRYNPLDSRLYMTPQLLEAFLSAEVVTKAMCYIHILLQGNKQAIEQAFTPEIFDDDLPIAFPAIQNYHFVNLTEYIALHCPPIIVKYYFEELLPTKGKQVPANLLRLDKLEIIQSLLLREHSDLIDIVSIITNYIDGSVIFGDTDKGNSRPAQKTVLNVLNLYCLYKNGQLSEIENEIIDPNNELSEQRVKELGQNESAYIDKFCLNFSMLQLAMIRGQMSHMKSFIEHGASVNHEFVNGVNIYHLMDALPMFTALNTYTYQLNTYSLKPDTFKLHKAIFDAFKLDIHQFLNEEKGMRLSEFAMYFLPKKDCQKLAASSPNKAFKLFRNDFNLAELRLQQGEIKIGILLADNFANIEDIHTIYFFHKIAKFSVNMQCYFISHYLLSESPDGAKLLGCFDGFIATQQFIKTHYATKLNILENKSLLDEILGWPAAAKTPFFLHSSVMPYLYNKQDSGNRQNDEKVFLVKAAIEMGSRLGSFKVMNQDSSEQKQLTQEVNNTILAPVLYQDPKYTWRGKILIYDALTKAPLSQQDACTIVSAISFDELLAAEPGSSCGVLFEYFLEMIELRYAVNAVLPITGEHDEYVDLNITSGLE